MHVTEGRSNYTAFYPLSDIYLSVPPKGKGHYSEGEDEETGEAKPKPKMWAEVESV